MKPAYLSMHVWRVWVLFRHVRWSKERFFLNHRTPHVSESLV